jgi:hypothetical protein
VRIESWDEQRLRHHTCHLGADAVIAALDAGEATLGAADCTNARFDPGSSPLMEHDRISQMRWRRGLSSEVDTTD